MSRAEKEKGCGFQILIYRCVKNATAVSCGKFFRRFFQKATAHPTRGALVAARTRRNLLIGVFFFAKLFSLRLYCQRKKRVSNLKRLCVERGTPHLCGSPLPSLRLVIHPSVALLKGKGVSPSAEGDRRSRRLRRAFEKARAKLSTGFAVKSPLNINLSTNKKALLSQCFLSF